MQPRIKNCNHTLILRLCFHLLGLQLYNSCQPVPGVSGSFSLWESQEGREGWSVGEEFGTWICWLHYGKPFKIILWSSLESMIWYITASMIKQLKPSRGTEAAQVFCSVVCSSSRLFLGAAQSSSCKVTQEWGSALCPTLAPPPASIVTNAVQHCPQQSLYGNCSFHCHSLFIVFLPERSTGTEPEKVQVASSVLFPSCILQQCPPWI